MCDVGRAVRDGFQRSYSESPENISREAKYTLLGCYLGVAGAVCLDVEEEREFKQD